jgi:hypothetical protein
MDQQNTQGGIMKTLIIATFVIVTVAAGLYPVAKAINQAATQAVATLEQRP